MAAERGTTGPIAGLVVVALFLSSFTFFGQRAFDPLRQPEGASGRSEASSEPPIEARLWEDPLAAMRRYAQKHQDSCLQVPPKASPSSGLRAPDPPKFWQNCVAEWARKRRAFKSMFDGNADVTVIAAMLQGGEFNGAEEGRRRTRYALLAGLKAEGFIPDYSERLNILQVARCDGFGCPVEAIAEEASSTAPYPVEGEEILGRRPRRPAAGTLPDASPMNVVFETLSTPGSDPKSQRRAAILWIDEAEVGKRWMSALVVMLRDLKPNLQQGRLRIIGPGSSQALVSALTDDLRLLEKEAAATVGSPGGTSPGFAASAKTLQDVRLITSLPTASTDEVLSAAHLPKCTSKDASCLSDTFIGRFNRVLLAVKAQQLDLSTKFVVRTNGTDEHLIDELVKELCKRGLDSRAPGRSRRVVVLAEWDSLYARTLSEALRDKLPSCAGDIVFESYPYLRGLDGATVGVAPPTGKPGDGKSAANAAGQIEWPEGPQQQDYVRRLVAQRLQKHNLSHTESVQAIGIFGSDVQDKLLLTQAVRDSFPDRVLFTTDLDARYLHPKVYQSTRNLVIASSLPLALGETWQRGIAPFRDSYQTAHFLAASYATAMDQKQFEDDAEKLIKPRLFEVSRGGALELPGQALGPDEERDRGIFALFAGLVLVLTGAAMLFFVRGPAMAAAASWLSKGAAPEQKLRRSEVILAGLQVAALGYAVGALVELAFAGGLGAYGPIWFSAAALAAAALLFWRPGTPWLEALRARREKASGRKSGWWPWASFALLAAAFIVVGGLLWWWIGLQVVPKDVREPFAPLSGASAWPSHLLRVLVVVLAAWFLDFAWRSTADASDQLEREYFDKTESLPDTWRRGFSFWRQAPPADANAPLDGATLWSEYRLSLRNWPRFWRLVVEFPVAIALVILITKLVGGGEPDVPARGIADRLLFQNGISVSAIAVLLLLTVVSDTTVMSWRFIVALKSGRTAYPRSTVAAFAAELGPRFEALASAPLAARIADREPPPACDENGTLVRPPTPEERAACPNSLLDDWIDARLLAEQTASVGRLILYPFVLVGLVVAARSRLFDNWDDGNITLAVLGLYLLLAVALAALLNLGAELARRKSLERMQADLLWLSGAGAGCKDLAGQFEKLIEQVRTLRKGAFAPFFEQPLVQAIMVPLGGAGGVKLVEYLVLARPS